MGGNETHCGTGAGKTVTVHFIGAGPGAADLLTLRAARLISESEVCVYAGTYLDADVLRHCSPDAELVDSQHLNLDEIVETMVRAHKAGRDVARLCSGDPSIYSALAEMTRRLDAAGVPWDVTPGVPAYAAAAALLGVELTVPELAQSVILTRAQRDSTQMPPEESIANFSRTRGTLVLHLAVRHVRRLVDQIVHDYGADCPVVVCAEVSSPRERVIRGTLDDIVDLIEASGLRQAAVIIIGWALKPGGFPDSHLYQSRRPPTG